MFDGIAGALVALKALGVQIKAYYAAEIDDAAIAVVKQEFPWVCHIGDVRGVTLSSLQQIGTTYPC